jgi:hypothetical protein
MLLVPLAFDGLSPGTRTLLSTEPVSESRPIQGKTEGRGEDERLNLIRGIVTPLREGVSAGVLTSGRGNFTWIPCRQAAAPVASFRL